MRSDELNEYLDRIGLGRYHYFQLILIGGIFVVDGAEILLSSAVLQSLQAVWKFDDSTKGWLMSTVLVGVLFGNFIGGRLADVVGRRVLVLTSLIGLVVFGGGASLCHSLQAMIAFRFCLGYFFGSAKPACIAITMESTTERWGKHLVNLGGAWFGVGEVYAAVLLALLMPDLEDKTDRAWREVVLLAVLPSLALIPFALGLQESPHFLLDAGRVDEAMLSLKAIAATSGVMAVVEDVELKRQQMRSGTPLESTGLLSAGTSGTAQVSTSPGPPPPEHRRAVEPWWKLFAQGRETNLCLVAGCYLCMVANSIYYGISYIMPGIFSQIPNTVPPAHQLIFAALACFPGTAVTELVLNMRVRDKTRLVIMCGVAGCALVCAGTVLALGKEHGKSILAAIIILRVFAIALFNLVYVFIGRAFAPMFRCTALAVCVGGGRVGSILSPLVAEYFHRTSPMLDSFFLFLSGLSCAALVVVHLCVPDVNYCEAEVAEFQRRRSNGSDLTDEQATMIKEQGRQLNASASSSARAPSTFGNPNEPSAPEEDSAVEVAARQPRTK